MLKEYFSPQSPVRKEALGLAPSEELPAVVLVLTSPIMDLLDSASCLSWPLFS